LVTFKVAGLGLDQVRTLIEPLVERLLDVREMQP
jgi:hypothetical protein